MQRSALINGVLSAARASKQVTLHIADILRLVACRAPMLLLQSSRCILAASSLLLRRRQRAHAVALRAAFLSSTGTTSMHSRMRLCAGRSKSWKSCRSCGRPFNGACARPDTCAGARCAVHVPRPYQTHTYRLLEKLTACRAVRTRWRSSATPLLQLELAGGLQGAGLPCPYRGCAESSVQAEHVSDGEAL